ncbi:hypothetical protein BGZ65_009244, partial [Modicella reniformis]
KQQLYQQQQAYGYVNSGSKEPTHKKKKSHSEGLNVAETKTGGSELVVPQQDSNSHARSSPPVKDMVQEIVYIQEFHMTTIQDDEEPFEYHEEIILGDDGGGAAGGNSMSDGEFCEHFEWSNHIIHHEAPSQRGRGHDEVGAGSLYLHNGEEARISNGYRIHSIQSGVVANSAIDAEQALAHYPESRHPGTVYVS